MSDSETTIREDVIYVGNEVILRDKVVMSGKYLGCAPNEGMITIASAYDLVEPLFERYSYLNNDTIQVLKLQLQTIKSDLALIRQNKFKIV